MSLPCVSLSRTGGPLASTSARILAVSPPRERPMHSARAAGVACAPFDVAAVLVGSDRTEALFHRSFRAGRPKKTRSRSRRWAAATETAGPLCRAELGAWISPAA